MALRRTLRRWAAAALAPGVLLALVLVFFAPAVLGLAWIPRGGGDLVSFLWPTYAYAANSLRAGQFPLWNPSLYSGAPFAADNQSSLFYPLNWIVGLIFSFSSFRSMELLVYLHFWLAGLGMYAALRMERAGRPAALAGAAAYMFSDLFITHIGNLNLVAVASYLPLLIACLRRGLAARSLGWVLAAGVVLSLAALAGHGQMTLIVGFGAALYGLWALAWTPGLWPRVQVLGLLAVWGLIALGLSAVALLPAVELTGYTARAHLDYAQAATGSMPLAGLASFFSPLVFGRGPAGFWGPWPRVESGYAGVLALVLAAGAFVFPRRKGERFDLFLALLFVLAVLLALGANTPVHRWFYEYVPGFSQVRIPARFFLLADLALAYLAGLGLQRLLDEPAVPRRFAILAGALAAGGVVAMLAAYGATVQITPDTGLRTHLELLLRGLALYGAVLGMGAAVLYGLARRRAGALRWGGAALAGLVALELIASGYNVEVEWNDPTRGYDHRAAIDYLRRQPGPARIDVATGAWPPDAAAMYGLEDIGGISNPLAIVDYNTYFWAVNYRGSPQYNFLNAQYVIADKGVGPGDGRILIPWFTGDPAVDVYSNTQALPRASLIYDVRLAADGKAAFDLCHTPDFLPTRTVVIENGPALAGGAPPAGASAVRYVEYGSQRLVVAARTPAPAYLVMAEVWYPGWRATVDGRPVPIYRANFAFRAVQVPAGDHQVELVFDPPAVRAGVAVTAATLAVLAVLSAGLGWRHRRRRMRQTRAD